MSSASGHLCFPLCASISAVSIKEKSMRCALHTLFKQKKYVVVLFLLRFFYQVFFSSFVGLANVYRLFIFFVYTTSAPFIPPLVKHHIMTPPNKRTKYSGHI